MRTLIAIVATLLLVAACSNPGPRDRVYGAQTARLGESLAVLGWNTAVSNLRWQDDYVLVDVDAAPTDPAKAHADPRDVRFGLYGALAHPMEAAGIGSCDNVKNVVLQSLSAPRGARLTGTVCLGPLQDRSAVRGVYLYSPRDRIAGTAAAYPAAFPVGVLPTKENDTGLVVKTTSVAAWRADGTQLTQASLGDPAAFTGSGYMLLGLVADTLAAKYRDDSAARGGPMMLQAAPTLPGPGLSAACAAYGSSVLILPEASLDAVHVGASLCTQGEINEALLYATVSVVGTHAAVWTAAMSDLGPTEWGTPSSGVGPWEGPPPDDPRYDPALLRDGDTRNVVDAYRYWSREAIIADIDNRRHPLHIAIENFGHDANIGGVVRTANAFAVHTVHIVGRRRWNRRGAMVTDRYQRLRHHDSTADLLSFAAGAGLTVVAVDNVPGAARLEQTTLPRDCLLVFGQEGPGISDEARAGASLTVSIAQFGSTRSINVAVAAGIAMHAWITQHGNIASAW